MAKANTGEKTVSQVEREGIIYKTGERVIHNRTGEEGEIIQCVIDANGRPFVRVKTISLTNQGKVTVQSLKHITRLAAITGESPVGKEETTVNPEEQNTPEATDEVIEVEMRTEEQEAKRQAKKQAQEEAKAKRQADAEERKKKREETEAKRLAEREVRLEKERVEKEKKDLQKHTEAEKREANEAKRLAAIAEVQKGLSVALDEEETAKAAYMGKRQVTGRLQRQLKDLGAGVDAKGTFVPSLTIDQLPDDLRAKVKACICGCGRVVAGSRSVYAPGHDQRVRGWLKEAEEVGEKPAAVSDAVWNNLVDRLKTCTCCGQPIEPHESHMGPVCRTGQCTCKERRVA